MLLPLKKNLKKTLTICAKGGGRERKRKGSGERSEEGEREILGLPKTVNTRSPMLSYIYIYII